MNNDGKITVCITSYDRFDLLKQTINSFNNLNTYPIERIVVIEDSTKVEMRDKIINEFGNKVDLIFNEQRIGQAPSLDKMYNTVTTQYIFHTEDDYFYSGNANFIKDSVELLEERQDVYQVWIKHTSDWNNLNHYDTDIFHTSTGIPYGMLKSPCDVWCGFSWFPGLRRTDDYHRFFPNGFKQFLTPQYLKSGVETEAACSVHVCNQGYRAAYLVNTSCSHKGLGELATYWQVNYGK